MEMNQNKPNKSVKLTELKTLNPDSYNNPQELAQIVSNIELDTIKNSPQEAEYEPVSPGAFSNQSSSANTADTLTLEQNLKSELNATNEAPETNSQDWGSDTNHENPQPTSTPTNAGIPDWDEQDIPVHTNQKQILASERSKKNKKRLASKAKKQLRFDDNIKYDNKTKSVAAKHLHQTADQTIRQFTNLLPEEIKVKRISKRLQEPIVIGNLWYKLKHHNEPTNPSLHWMLPFNTIEKQAFLHYIKENKISLNRNNQELEYNAPSYIDRVKAKIRHHENSSLNKEAKQLWHDDRNNYHHKLVKPLWYFTYDKSYYVPIATQNRKNKIRQKYNRKSVKQNTATKANELAQKSDTQNKQNKKRSSKSKKAETKKTSPTRPRSNSPKRPEIVNQAQVLDNNQKGQTTSDSVPDTNSPPEDSAALLSDLLQLQLDAYEIDQQYDSINKNSTKELNTLLRNTYKWVRKHHSYENFLTDKSIETYSRIISNTKLGKKITDTYPLTDSEKEIIETVKQQQKSKIRNEPIVCTFVTRHQIAEQSEEQKIRKVELINESTNLRANYLWVLECRWIDFHNQFSQIQVPYPQRALIQPNGSLYSQKAYATLAVDLLGHFRLDLERNPEHLFYPQGQYPDHEAEGFSKKLIHPTNEIVLAYYRYYCDELLNQAYYPQGGSLKFSAARYIYLTKRDSTTFFSDYQWTQDPKYQDIDVAEGPTK
jgi:hypothetical protein